MHQKSAERLLYPQDLKVQRDGNRADTAGSAR
ncbi:Uncharacterised protein [Serratia odorifera]|uniref:Uncharacterized protein n=1 Tax=Serratia odorifera TaxID=618 RepID=A0A447KPJ4_SEROD|nr:Uncharacterised protein [Serratia odorifera]